jgi:hypothetical protein
MYYNINDKILVPRVPKTLLRPDNSIFINFNKSNINTLADYGYYTIRNDNNQPPSTNSIEDVTSRKVILDKPYADVSRKWITPNSK